MPESLIQFKRLFSFDDIISLYEKQICVGLPLCNIYGLSAVNREEGIILNSDKRGEYTAFKSETAKISEPAERIIKTFNQLFEILENIQSSNPFLRHAAGLQMNKDKISLDLICDKRIDQATVYKIADDIPLIGEFLELEFPFVNYREIRLNRENDKTIVKIITDSPRDLRKMSDYLARQYPHLS